ncbi:MAG: hypothetical protein IT492_01945 [Gammaproteobacteria bacterium]|nr:hypothetical protein [Gammaproteobacteria bacterium]
MCRHVHAAPYVIWIVVRVDKFKYTTHGPAALKSLIKRNALLLRVVRGLMLYM